MKEQIRKRNHSLDVIRIVAVLAVVMIHCSAPFVTNYGMDSVEFLLGNLFNGIVRPGVPLFLMISGALFLDERKEITLKGILSKNVKSIAVITIVWSVFYSLVYHVITPTLKGLPVDPQVVVDDILCGHGHMWYLYMIMGLYTITPFLKKFVSRENKDLVLFFIGISFVTQFLLPLAHAICVQHWELYMIGDLVDLFHLDFFGGYIAYFLTGWYIVHIGVKRKSAVYSAGFAALVLMVLYSHLTGDYKLVYADISAPVYLYSTAVFLLLNSANFHFEGKAAAVVASLSKISFGIYITHVLILNVFRKVFPYSAHAAVYLLVCFAAVTCASFLCSCVMSRIPLLKKLVKM